MKKNNGGKSSLFLGLFQILCGFILVMMVSGEKDSWEYYMSSSHRSSVDTGSMIGWLIVLAGVVELVYGLIVMSATDNVQPDAVASEKDEEITIDWVEGEIVKKEWNPEEPQIEWLVVQRSNGSVTKVWRHTSNPVVYKVGDRGLFRIEERRITEFVQSENEQPEAE